MREDWNKTGYLELTAPQVEKLLRAAYPSARVASFKPTDGGLANTNLIVHAVDAKNPVLLRLFVREPIAALKEYAIYSLVDGTVPVPKLHFFSRENSVNGFPYMVMEYVEGERLENVLKIFPEKHRKLGESVGSCLAAIHEHSFEKFGFLDGGLKVADEIDLGGAGLIAYGEQCLSYETALVRLGERLAARLVKFLAAYAALLDGVATPSLTHCDFGGSNIIVESGAANVKAIIDWEFACSGTPYFDFGNLLRSFSPDSEFVAGVQTGFTVFGAGRTLPENWLLLSRMADLFAWLEFLGRPAVNDALLADIRANVETTIELVSQI
jgi:aminoglycoside phosphotransferase (APT) family kinase protein